MAANEAAHQLCSRRNVLAQTGGLTAAGLPTPDATALLDWAERTYPQFFPSARTNQVAAPYTFRYYPETGNYAGVAGSGIWVLGPVAGSATAPLYVGELADFACAVFAKACSAEPPAGDHCFRLTESNYLWTDRLVPDRGPFTVEVWVFDAGAAQGYAEILSQGAQPLPFYLGTSPVTREIRVGDAWLATGATLPPNRWVHVAVTRGVSGAMSLYLDGRRVSSKADAAYSGAAVGQFRIGRQYGDGGEFFEGCVDDLKVWRVERTPAQIADDMRKTAVSSPDLIAHYDFNTALEPARVWQAGRAAGNVLQSAERLAELVPVDDVAALSRVVRTSPALSTCADGRCGYYLIADVLDLPQNIRGVSWYSSAWAFAAEPIGGLQVGFGSTWINPDLRTVVAAEPQLLPRFCAGSTIFDEATLRSYGDKRWILSQSIEGSLGYWTSLKFRSAVPKYRPNATADCYRTEVGSPGWSFVTGQPLERSATAMVQLSNRLLIPPDGLTLRPETRGESLGIAWMSLPWPSIAATDPATGTQAWTLFLNASNFRGPLAYLLPQAWSAQSQADPLLAGLGLDSRSGYIGSMSAEMGVIPLARATDAMGVEFSRMPALSFPVDANGRTYFTRDTRFWFRDAFEIAFGEWASGRRMTLGRFVEAAGQPMKLSTSSRAVTQGGRVVRGYDDQAQVRVFDNGDSWGLQWSGGGGDTRQLPSYFRRDGDTVTVVNETDVPASTGLPAFRFEDQRYRVDAYAAPAPLDWWDSNGSARPSGWARLADGSVVEYRWYRFVDQPALQRLSLSGPERDQLQALVTRLHRVAPDTAFMPPPSTGGLIGFDEALLVVPPPGLEVGHVPIVVAQHGRSRLAPGTVSGQR